MEIWKNIPSYPKYEVSNMGRVRHGSRILHTRPHRNGYVLTTLGIGNPSVYLHHIVAEAFVGPRPRGFDIDHIDFDKKNNRPENLRYVTRSENIRKNLAAGIGRVPTTEQKARGEKQWCARLTAEKVREIRTLAKAQEHKTEIARKYGISVGQVFRIVSRKQWKHV